MASVLAGATTCALIVPSLAHAEAPGHLVISELVTGGATGSDEFVELLNPTDAAISLANLELVYVTATGGTITRRAAWAADAPLVPPAGYVLVANEAGIYSADADARYSSGIAEAGGAVVLRSVTAAIAIDAVAWGTAIGSLGEGLPAPAPAPGSSLERRPAADGAVQDTGDNAADFVLSSTPTPRGSPAASIPSQPTMTSTPSPEAAATPVPTGTPTSSQTTSPSATASESPHPTPISIAAARGMADGTMVTVEGVALTPSDLHDGGGFVVDEMAGIAVIVTGASFAPGQRLVVTGTVDDRFAQRTIRADASGIRVVGVGVAAPPIELATGELGESHEGRLVRLVAVVRSAPTALSAGLAFDLDDGSGPARVVVGSDTAISTASWVTGAEIELVAVGGQRDASGSGSAGYRAYPRSPGDVIAVRAPAATIGPSPTAASASPAPVASAGPAPRLSIAAARRLPVGARVTVRGTLTFPPGVLDAATAVLEDDTAAIVVRIDEPGVALLVGDVVEVEGVRSTRSGMETVRATTGPRVVSTAAITPVTIATSDVGEAIEARLVAVSGTLIASARRAASGTVTFDLADGRGEVRVVLPSSLRADDSLLVAGATVEVVGVVGQETTGAEPNAGYRIWPRAATDVRLRQQPGAATPVGGSARGAQTGAGDPLADATAVRHQELESLGAVGVEHLRVGATLVTGAWPELGVAGLLWDGSVLVAIAAESEPALSAVGHMLPPVALRLLGVRPLGLEPRTGARLVTLGVGAGAVVLGAEPAAAPLTSIPTDGRAAWVTLLGRLVEDAEGLGLLIGDRRVAVEMHCASGTAPPASAAVSVTGVGLDGPPRVLVPCGGLKFAPALLRAEAETPHASARRPEPMGGRSEGETVRPVDRRPLAAWLLLLGTTAVGGGALAWRRFGTTQQEADGEDRDAADAPDDGVGGEAEPGLRPLALVRLQRDGRQ